VSLYTCGRCGSDRFLTSVLPAGQLPRWACHQCGVQTGGSLLGRDDRGLLGGIEMLHATRIALIQTLQARLAEECAMITKLRDRYIELDIERFAAELEARED
jgi:hypothetical protein